RNVAQHDLAEVGQAGLGADAGKFRHHDFNLVIRILIRPGLDFGQRGIDSGACVFVRILAFHANCLESRSRNRPTSATTPTAWPVPRSLTFVATAGLISTHTTFTHPGSMLPVAIECSIDPRQSTRPAPFNCSA